MSVWSVIGIVMCVIEVGLIIFMTISLLKAFDIYDDFKQYISDWLEDLERKLEGYKDGEK
jgi:hypothetical protein